jgi:hypothetical protein
MRINKGRHPRLSGIGRRNTLNAKKDSGQAGMTELGHLIAGVIILHLQASPQKRIIMLAGFCILIVLTYILRI